MKWYAIYSKILSLGLVLLGFNACEDQKSMVEYGTPSATYKVSGKVVSSAETTKAIKNIRVVMIEDMGAETSYIQGDTTYTGEAGTFEINRHSFPYSKFKIKLQDVDGDENGLFDSKEQVIMFENSDYKNGSGSWHVGEAKKDMGTIEMNPK